MSSKKSGLLCTGLTLVVPCRRCSALSWRWPHRCVRGTLPACTSGSTWRPPLSMLLDITRLMDLIFQQSTPAGADALTRPDQNKVTQLSEKPASLQGRLWGVCYSPVSQKQYELGTLQQLDALLASRAVAGCGQWGFTRPVLRRCC